MSKKNLVICDKVLRFASALGENVSARNEFSLSVYVCTSLESVMQLKENKEIHILIVDDAFTYNDRRKMNAEQTFVLTKEKCLDLSEDEIEIYKFQSANKILATVFEVYCSQTNSNLLKGIRKRKTTLLAVYSPIHRVGKTTFAIALGKEIAKTQRTLYLNLEERADVNERFVRAEGRNLGDLFYYMYQDGINVPLRIATMVEQLGKLDYIPPFLVSNDLKEISLEEWKQLLKVILEECGYKTVILDVSDCVDGLFEVLECCDEIYMPVLEDEISRRKINMLEEELKNAQLEKLLNKIHRFTVEKDMEMCARRLIQEERQHDEIGGASREDFG